MGGSRGLRSLSLITGPFVALSWWIGAPLARKFGFGKGSPAFRTGRGSRIPLLAGAGINSLARFAGMAPIPAAPPLFGEEPHAADLHGGIQGLGHVVDGQQTHLHSGEGLHFHPRPGMGIHGSLNS